MVPTAKAANVPSRADPRHTLDVLGKLRIFGPPWGRLGAKRHTGSCARQRRHICPSFGRATSALFEISDGDFPGGTWVAYVRVR
jgi:hypothetical protein